MGHISQEVGSMVRQDLSKYCKLFVKGCFRNPYVVGIVGMKWTAGVKMSTSMNIHWPAAERAPATVTVGRRAKAKATGAHAWIKDQRYKYNGHRSERRVMI